MMRFQPKSAEQIALEGLLPDGVYDFEVQSAEDTTSRAGNDMIALKLKVYDAEGNTRVVRDWLLDSAMGKLRGACEVCGIMDRYDAGALEASDFEGKSGKVKIKVQPAQNGYEPSNKVSYYTSAGPAAKQPERRPAMAAAGRSDLDDDIPF